MCDCGSWIDRFLTLSISPYLQADNEHSHSRSRFRIRRGGTAPDIYLEPHGKASLSASAQGKPLNNSLRIHALLFQGGKLYEETNDTARAYAGRGCPRSYVLPRGEIQVGQIAANVYHPRIEPVSL